MRILGAILAGGQSVRFGSDKALHLHEGKPLIAHVAHALALQCETLVLCGREWGGLPHIADHPGPGLGPMGGLCAALRHAEANGQDAVLCAPCDVLGLPADAATRLSPGPAVAEGQWLIGLWPSALASALEDLLAREGGISARRWIESSRAAAHVVAGIRNINWPFDLA